MGDATHRARMLAATAAALAALTAPAAGARPPKAPLAAAHDLTGTWTNAWYTKLERPKEFTALVATPAQAEAYEAPRRALKGELASKDDVVGQNESEFPDNGPGLARIGGQLRSSWIVEPPDGKIPWIAGMRKRLIEDDPPDDGNVEHRDTDERCLTSESGMAPLTNSHDTNLIEIVQTPGWLVIVGERNTTTRIVDLGGAGARPAGRPAVMGSWTGVSVGHWEGATLVVETRDLRPGLTKIGDSFYLSDRAVVTERFTRTGPHEISYGFTVEDPTLFTRAWRGEEVLRTAEGRMFEFACHEGNYALPDILRAAAADHEAKPVEAKAGGAKAAAGAATTTK